MSKDLFHAQRESELENIINQTQTKMKTSKIKEVKEVKPWGEGDRKTYYHNLVMENEDKINIGKKKEQQVGWELTYEIIEEGQQEYNKAKAVMPEGKNFPTESKYTPTPDNLKGIKIGHAITNGVNLAMANRDPVQGVTMDEVEMYANKILELAEKMNG